LLLWLLALLIPTAQGGECAADRIDEEARIAYIYDGDTVRLKDGRKVRLAGINAPELGKKGLAGEPLAEEARAYLSRLFEGVERVQLRYEEQRHDRYGRLLAHLYLPEGDNIEARLLDAGLAQQLVVPPNTWQSGCYQHVERRARQQQRGIWRLDYYQPLREMPARSDEGKFRVIGGTVVRAAESRKSLWLNLDSGLAVRVARRDLPHFSAVDLLGLQGQQVVARGWLRHHGQYVQLSVRHPTALMRASDWK